ncbi:MAG: glucosidase, partial [Gammaproteobacteria bacterium]
MTNPASVEHARLSTDGERWKAWGPYLSERQWGTVREDYSPHGNAWEYFPHDHARSRAYRWGEDGIAGFSDREQRLCFALALWNGRDPILKERLFGLTNGEGNHGEDVKELYYYLDATPTHSYLKMLYKYPQGEYPYARLLEENRRRGIGQPEFELVDSGLFEANRYFDVFVEYAQAEPGDILIQITVENRGPEAASIHLLPQLWFRNTWSWKADGARPVITQSAPGVIRAEHPDLGVYHLHADGRPTELLFCDNESNNHRLWNQPRTAGFFKDGFNDRVVLGDTTGVNPAQCGTKAAPWYTREVPAAGRIQIRLRLCRELRSAAFQDFDRIFTCRLREADEFYAHLQRDIPNPDARLVQRQAFAGMIWSKQYFYFDVAEWIKGDPSQPPPPANRRCGRNREWQHLNNADIISMPDKWEYPWYAAWDLA